MRGSAKVKCLAVGCADCEVDCEFDCEWIVHYTIWDVQWNVKLIVKWIVQLIVHCAQCEVVEKLNQELLSSLKVLPQSQASSRLYKIAFKKNKKIHDGYKDSSQMSISLI